MKLIIEMNLDNAAFAEYGGHEIKRLLGVVGKVMNHDGPLETPIEPQRLIDYNGNVCGFWEVKQDEPNT